MPATMDAQTIEALEPQAVWRLFAGMSEIPRPSKKEERIRDHIRKVAEGMGFTVRQDAQGNLAIDHKSQGNGVLLSAQESFGAVDGVQSPKAIAVGLGVATVDPVTDISTRGGGDVFGDVFHNPGEHLFVPGFLQHGGIFFANDWVVGKNLSQGPTDERLAAKVGDGDRALVLF